MQSSRSTHLGKYQLVAEIARGGMGIVYLAISTGPARFSKLLVVKELKPELADDPSFTEMFLEEARLAARLSHPNIVQTYEIGVDGARQYMVMDYLEGVTLARIVRKKSPAFTRDIHLRVICDVLQALQYAHELKDFDGTPLGMVHRDVSPQNVFVTYDGQAKLVDFGIAKAFDSAVETRTGMLKGKPSYMAPEQMHGHVDTRADLYSVGVMIWEAIAGRRMWYRRSDIEVLSSLVAGNLPSLEEAAPDAPPELIAIAKRALAKDPDERYARALDLRQDIASYLRAAGSHAGVLDAAEVAMDLFRAERESTRATIESHLTRIRSGKDPEKLPSIRPPVMDAPNTPSLAGLSDSSESSINSLTSQPSSKRDFSSVGSRSVPPGSTPSLRTPKALEVPVEYEEVQRRRNHRALVPAILIGGAVIAVVAFFGGRWKDKSTNAGAESAAASVVAVSLTADGASGAVAPASPPALAGSSSLASSTDAAVAAGSADTPTPSTPSTGSANGKTQTTATASRWSTSSTSSRASTKDKDAPGTIAEPQATEPSTGMGYLTLDTFPYTHVSMGGQALGDTPLVHIALPAGAHTLTLENADENIHKSTVVTIKAGDTVSRRLAF